MCPFLHLFLHFGDSCSIYDSEVILRINTLPVLTLAIFCLCFLPFQVKASQMLLIYLCAFTIFWGCLYNVTVLGIQHKSTHFLIIKKVCLNFISFMKQKCRLQAKLLMFTYFFALLDKWMSAYDQNGNLYYLKLGFLNIVN